MKRLSLVFATSILAFAVLFGALIGQSGVAQAASIPNSTRGASISPALQAAIFKVEQDTDSYHAWHICAVFPGICPLAQLTKNQGR